MLGLEPYQQGVRSTFITLIYLHIQTPIYFHLLFLYVKFRFTPMLAGLIINHVVLHVCWYLGFEVFESLRV